MRTFTHKDKFSSYMQPVLEEAGQAKPGARALDMPAGAGRLSDALRNLGYDVTSADINDERPDFVAADLNQRLPFDDETFDLVTCLEGIEHTLYPTMLIQELARILKPDGKLIITTPNILNIFSRLQFFLSGTFYLFHPAVTRIAPPQASLDRGHISPVSYHVLRYHTECHGLKFENLRTDRYKKKAMFIFVPLIKLIGVIFGPSHFKDHPLRPDTQANRRAMKDTYSLNILMGRTLVFVARKPAKTTATSRQTATTAAPMTVAQ